MRQQKNQKLAIISSLILDHISGALAIFCGYALILLAIRKGYILDFNALDKLGKNALLLSGIWILAGNFAIAALIFRLLLPLDLDKDKLFQFFLNKKKLATLTLIQKNLRKTWHLFLAAVAISFPALLFYLSSYWAAARALGVEISLAKMLAISQIADVIASVPVSVAGIGVRESIFENLLNSLASVKAEMAISISLLGFAFNIFWSIPGLLLFITNFKTTANFKPKHT